MGRKVGLGAVRKTTSNTQTTRGYRRVQGAALVAVRKPPINNARLGRVRGRPQNAIIYISDGHKGRTLHTPEPRDDYFIRWS